jgi:hypothetical protein
MTANRSGCIMGITTRLWAGNFSMGNSCAIAASDSTAIRLPPADQMLMSIAPVDESAEAVTVVASSPDVWRGNANEFRIDERGRRYSIGDVGKKGPRADTDQRHCEEKASTPATNKAFDSRRN